MSDTDRYKLDSITGEVLLQSVCAALEGMPEAENVTIWFHDALGQEREMTLNLEGEYRQRTIN